MVQSDALKKVTSTCASLAENLDNPASELLNTNKQACLGMNKSGKYFVSSVLVYAAVLFGFYASWQVGVGTAASLGHAQRGGVPFGITVNYGFQLFALLAALLVVMEYRVKSRRTRALFHGAALMAWCVLCVPSTDAYPIRGSAFLIMGVAFYLCLVFALNRLARFFRVSNIA